MMEQEKTNCPVQDQKQTHTQEKAAQEALQMIAENMDHSIKSIRTSTHPYAK